MVNEINDVDAIQNDKLINDEGRNEASRGHQQNLWINPEDNDYFSNT